MSLNSVQIQGNLVRDPESRQAGTATVVQFTVANSQKRKEADETAFIDCEAWGKTGELVQQYLTKGAACIVEGRLKQDNWQDKDGNKRSKIKIVAERVHFLGGKREAAQPQGETVGSDGLRRDPKPQGGASAGSDDPPFARSELEAMP